MVEVLRTDEKRSEVNLASHLLIDACTGDFEKALVISNDSDFRISGARRAGAALVITVGVSCPIARPGRRAARPLVQSCKLHITHHPKAPASSSATASSPTPSSTPPAAQSTNHPPGSPGCLAAQAARMCPRLRAAWDPRYFRPDSQPSSPATRSPLLPTPPLPHSLSALTPHYSQLTPSLATCHPSPVNVHYPSKPHNPIPQCPPLATRRPPQRP